MALNTSLLTPFQLTAGASLLQNQGLRVNPALTAAIAAFNAQPIIAKIAAVIAASGVLNAGNIATLKTLGSSTCPALSNSIPTAYISLLGTGSFSGTVSTKANTYMGNGDLSKFAQLLAAADGYASLTNTFINSSNNSQTYLANTYPGANNTVTGGITGVNLNTDLFGQDLTNLGNLWNLEALDQLGTPAALMKQLAVYGGIFPQLALLFNVNGVSLDTVISFTDPTLDVSAQEQKIMYDAMTQVTGDTLSQVLQLLSVKTANINTMADLLNPYKLFPNSFLSLTVTLCEQGVSKHIYLNAQGTVNSSMLSIFPNSIKSRLGTLEIIEPPDIALANLALYVSLSQVTGISNMRLPTFAAAVSNTETNYGLPLLNDQSTAVPSSVTAYYNANLAKGTGPKGTITIYDIMGTPTGYIHTAAFTTATATLSGMSLGTLLSTYQTMLDVETGVYGNPTTGPVTITSGPYAGTYTNANDAFSTALIPGAQTIISGLASTGAGQILNTQFNKMGAQLNLEASLQGKAGIVLTQLVANLQTATYGLVFQLPGYGRDTQVGGTNQYLQNLTNLSIAGGQAIIGCMREGLTNPGLRAAGIGTVANVPDALGVIPPQAPLLPSQYPYPS